MAASMRSPSIPAFRRSTSFSRKSPIWCCWSWRWPISTARKSFAPCANPQQLRSSSFPPAAAKRRKSRRSTPAPIRAHLRGAAKRNAGNGAASREVVLDLSKRMALVRGHAHKLTRKELALLQVLMRDADRIVPHHFILQKLWGASHDMSAQYLRVLVRRLRQKIEIDPASPKLLLTEAGVGYR